MVGGQAGYRVCEQVPKAFTKGRLFADPLG